MTMSIAKNLNFIKKKIPENIVLVAVSKTKYNSEILEAYNEGQRVFGENKVQELIKKNENLPNDIDWHMIGHLQTNKVKYIAPFIKMIHSVDSIKLLKEINKRAGENNRIINCLFQVNISRENTKYGFIISEIEKVFKESESFKNINIKGIMGMATYTDNKNQINKEFSELKELFKKVRTKKINILSTGMSSDYKEAINNGSNMIRVGSAIYGNRN